LRRALLIVGSNFVSRLNKRLETGSSNPGRFARWSRPFSLIRWPESSDLTVEPARLTLLDLKTSTLTIRLDKDLNELLTKVSRRSGKNRSEVAREALRRQLRISQFEALRRKIMPFAEARGYLTDEDVFADVS